jgi:predicted DNA-binding transcriptional regulator AlpA
MNCPLVRLLIQAGCHSSPIDATSQGPILVTVQEAAQQTGMSRAWFYDHSEAPFMRRFGRSCRVDLSALEGWAGERHERQGSRAPVSTHLPDGSRGEAEGRRLLVEVRPDSSLDRNADRRRSADLRRAGVPLAEAMGQLGHRDVRTHQDYSTVARADQTEALARLEALRAGEPVQQRLAMIRR